MRTLLVTNDFPPRLGGIQSYLRDYVSLLDPREICVFASTQDAAACAQHDAEQPFAIHRYPRRVMLPTPATERAMSRLIAKHSIHTVWFGAAAPLAIMSGAARRAGAQRIVATTHGHEVGWSMVPGGRGVLRRIGRTADVVTYVSEYTRRRFSRALGDHPQYVHLPSGVDTEAFHPVTVAERRVIRARYGLPKDAPTIICVSRLVPRKGQDQLLRVMPEVLGEYPDAQLVLVGAGRYQATLEVLARPVAPNVHLLGSLQAHHLRALVAAADIFAMPARTRGRGLDVEGLGIVYLEAQACGLPVVAGNSGGAPETVTSDTGIVVDGADTTAVADALLSLLADPRRREAMGQAGRRHVCEQWTWDIMGERLRTIL